MQTELAGTGISILGVNRLGSASASPSVCEGRDIPWLEDDPADSTWQLWNVTYRDVYIVGPDNEFLAVYNLTDNNLANADRYAELKAMIEEAAAR